MPLSVALFLIATIGLMGLVMGWRLGRVRGYREGYQHARTLPIGVFQSLIGGSIGFTGMAQLDDDVVVLGPHHSEDKP